MSPPWTERSTPAPGGGDTPSRCDATLTGLVLRRRDLATRLAALSRSQSARIASGDVEGAMEIMTEREPLVEDLAAVSAELRRRASELARLLDETTPAERRRLRDAIDESQAELDAVAERDGADLRALEASRAFVGEGMTEHARARAAVGAYDGGRAVARVQDREV